MFGCIAILTLSGEAVIAITSLNLPANKHPGRTFNQYQVTRRHSLSLKSHLLSTSGALQYPRSLWRHAVNNTGCAIYYDEINFFKFQTFLFFNFFFYLCKNFSHSLFSQLFICSPELRWDKETIKVLKVLRALTYFTSFKTCILTECWKIQFISRNFYLTFSNNNLYIHKIF